MCKSTKFPSLLGCFCLLLLYTAPAFGQRSTDDRGGYNKVDWGHSSLDFLGKERLRSFCSLLKGQTPNADFDIYRRDSQGITIYALKALGERNIGAQSFAGLLFEDPLGSEQAVAMWRYKP